MKYECANTSAYKCGGVVDKPGMICADCADPKLKKLKVTALNEADGILRKG